MSSIDVERDKIHEEAAKFINKNNSYFPLRHSVVEASEEVVVGVDTDIDGVRRDRRGSTHQANLSSSRNVLTNCINNSSKSLTERGNIDTDTNNVSSDQEEIKYRLLFYKNQNVSADYKIVDIFTLEAIFTDKESGDDKHTGEVQY